MGAPSGSKQTRGKGVVWCPQSRHGAQRLHPCHMTAASRASPNRPSLELPLEGLGGSWRGYPLPWASG